MQRPEFDRRLVGAYLGLGAGFALTTLVFAALGSFLDRHIGTTPLFTLIGVFFGGAAGFYTLYRRAMAAQEGDGKKDPRGREPSEPSEDVPEER